MPADGPQTKDVIMNKIELENEIAKLENLKVFFSQVGNINRVIEVNLALSLFKNDLIKLQDEMIESLISKAA